MTACNHELGLLFSEFVGFHFEFAVKGLGDVLLTLLFALGLNDSEFFSHFGSDLLRSLEGSHELLFVLLVFSSKHGSQPLFPSVEVRCLSASHVIDSVSYDVVLNNLVSLVLPLSLLN